MDGPTAIKKYILFFVLSQAAWADGRRKQIPNRLIGAACILRLLLCIVEWRWIGSEAWRCLGFDLMKSLVFAAALVCGAAVSRYAFGFGDVKLLGAVVLFGGIGLAVDCLIYGVLLAGWICFVLLLLGRLGRRDKLPLAPFFLLGYICALLFGSFGP